MCHRGVGGNFSVRAIFLYIGLKIGLKNCPLSGNVCGYVCRFSQMDWD
jgi:hypothetical protein